MSKYNNSGNLIEQALIGIKSGADVIKNTAQEEYFNQNRYDVVDPILRIYLMIGDLVVEAKWAEERRQWEEEEKASVSRASFDDIPLPSETKSSYALKGDAITLEFSYSNGMTADQEERYKNFVCASIGNRDIKKEGVLAKAIASFEKNKEAVYADHTDTSSLEFAPDEYKVFALELATASETISENGIAQLVDIKKSFEAQPIEMKTSIGTVVIDGVTVGKSVSLKSEDGSIVEISKASFDVFGGATIDVIDSRIVKVDSRELMKTLTSA